MAVAFHLSLALDKSPDTQTVLKDLDTSLKMLAKSPISQESTDPVACPDRRAVLLNLLRLGGLASASAAMALWLNSRSRHPEEETPLALNRSFTIPPNPNFPQIVVAQDAEPEMLARRAIKELGGIERFISRGDVVVIKPNIAWDRTPEQAANTNPDLVGEMVRLCREAGAKKVVVTDVGANEVRRCFNRSGIALAARSAGGEVILPKEREFQEVNLRGEVLGVWPVFEPFLAADKMINLPIAKHHNLTGVTLGMKNWYGILGGQRHRLHQRIHESLADLADFMRPTLTLIDAYRVLMRNGPAGGALEDVALKKTVIAGTDPVALDALAAKAYWDLDSRTLPYLKLAQDRGLGRMDFENVKTSIVKAA